MNYDQLKSKFEQIITRMQDDLKKDAQQKWCTEKAVNYRLQLINDLVDFYNATDELIGEQAARLMESQIQYARLHGDAHKLVLFTRLHRISPDLIFYYTAEELQHMYKQGVRFRPPVKSFNKMRVVANGETYDIQYQEDSDEQHERFRVYETKYNQLQARSIVC